MAVMLIESADPNFSHILKKNPMGGMTIKSMRSGVLSGWYPKGDVQKYALWFRETSTENSFSNEDGKNYLDLTQYASTYFVFNSLSTFFNHALKIDNNQSSYLHKITIPNVQLRNVQTLHHLNKFVNAGIGYVTKTSDGESDRMALYEISIVKECPLNEFLMRVYLLFYLLHGDLYASDIVWMEGMITKVVGMLVELQAEYFLWYWFKKNILVKPKFYAELESKLGKNSIDGNIIMQYGDTQTQRKNFVNSHINSFDLSLLDVGCGGGDYLLPYAKKLAANQKYIVGVEVDTSIINKLRNKLIDRKQTNAIVVSDLSEADMDELHDIICIEVIEHMSYDEATELVKKLLNRNFRKLIISTPNSDFNKFYKTMTGFRHDDHKFEFDTKEFLEFINTCVESNNLDTKFKIKHIGVGDSVNNIYMSQAVIITKE